MTQMAQQHHSNNSRKFIPYFLQIFQYTIIKNGLMVKKMVCVWVNSLGIAPTSDCIHFIKIDSWSPGFGFIPVISTKGINQIKKENCKKNYSIHFKKIYIYDIIKKKTCSV